MLRVLTLLSLLFLADIAQAQSPMVSDLSTRRIGIESDFTGAELLLFGSIAEAGDVVVVVKGPPQDLTVRRKRRIAGIWVNADAVTFQDMPGFYAVASNRPLADIASDRVLRRHAIGIDNLKLESARNDFPEDGFDQEARRLRVLDGLYREDPNGVSIRGEQLFRSNIAFPANVPVGQYTAQVYLFQDGQVVSAETSPILIDKSGMERAVYTFAHQWPLLYGIFAVIIAAFSGWGAAQVFRKG